MPTNIRIIHTEDFIRATPDGSLDLAASRSLLKDLVTESAAGNHNFLLDAREAHIHLSTADIFELGVRVADESVLSDSRKLALLVPAERDLDASFFEAVSTNRGANVRAFPDFEPAISWLIMKEHGS